MVMGPTHSMSGAAFWLSASALGANLAGLNTSSLPVILLGTAACAGAALAPDIDSPRSTVVNSYGFLGRIGYQVANFLSLTAYEMTRTKYDNPRQNGHRTLFHTTFMAVLVGGIVALLSSLPGTIDILSKTFQLGQLFSITIMGAFLHLALAGIFEKQVKKYRKKFGPYILMGITAALTILIAYLLPPNEKYAWLGISVGAGWFIHLLGDMITKMGVPMFAPLKIRGKRWYDITLPAFMRIKANGKFEHVVLLPLLSLITAIALFLHIPGMKNMLSSLWNSIF